MPKGVEVLDIKILERLREMVQRSLPFSLEINKNYTQFSDFIYASTNQYLSVSTLRRVFQYENNTSPSLYTLNTICKAIGYSSWAEFEEKETQRDENEFYEIILMVKCQGYSNWDEFLTIFNQFVDTPHVYNVSLALIEAALKKKDIVSISNIFDLPVLFTPDHYFGQQSYFFTHLGILLYNNTIIHQLIPFIARHPVAQVFLVEQYVEEEYLNEHYGALLDEYHKHKTTLEAQLFYHSLTCQKKMENSETNNESLLFLINFIETEPVHAIPKIRRLALLIIHFSDNKEMVDNLLSQIPEILRPLVDGVRYFCGLLFCRLLFARRLLYPIKKMIEYSDIQSVNPLHKIGVIRHLNYLKIYQAYVLVSNGDTEAAEIMLQNFNKLLICPYTFKRFNLHFDIVTRMIETEKSLNARQL